jgi:hypothetical protein
MKAFILGLVVLFGMAAASLAQSLPNYGPNAPATGDSLANLIAAQNP